LWIRQEVEESGRAKRPSNGIARLKMGNPRRGLEEKRLSDGIAGLKGGNL
jgi:hypothetical protein